MHRPLAALSWSLAALGWAALVWWLLCTPSPPEPQLSWLPPAIAAVGDKLGHAALFLVQAALLERALARAMAARRAGAGRRATAVLVACLLLGTATEWRQRTIPTRHAEAADIVADGAGALLYALVMLAARSRVAARTEAGS